MNFDFLVSPIIFFLSLVYFWYCIFSAFRRVLPTPTRGSPSYKYTGEKAVVTALIFAFGAFLFCFSFVWYTLEKIFNGNLYVTYGLIIIAAVLGFLVQRHSERYFSHLPDYDKVKHQYFWYHFNTWFNKKRKK